MFVALLPKRAHHNFLPRLMLGPMAMSSTVTDALYNMASLWKLHRMWEYLQLCM